MNNTPYKSVYAIGIWRDTNPSATKKRRGLEDALPPLDVSVGEGSAVCVVVALPGIVEVIFSSLKYKNPNKQTTNSNPHRTTFSFKITTVLSVTQSGKVKESKLGNRLSFAGKARGPAGV